MDRAPSTQGTRILRGVDCAQPSIRVEDRGLKELSGQVDLGGTMPTTPMAEYDLVEVAAAMRSLSQRVADDDDDRGPVQRLAEVAVERVPGARWASVSMLHGGRFTTAAWTGEQAVRADVLQFEIGSGPCVDAVLGD